MTKNSKVLSLKYRPQIFGDLIGQETATQTIYNSIKLEKIPNAYLFTGIRGVGKTTTARIIAKSLNCKNGIEKLCEKNLCENCISIMNSNHIDVLEMDAASKTGVEDVRDLIEFSRYPPSVAKYKIFIIDEVHMLSRQAFNALLKTLEEPPEYLKFIFATTEIKKIPITVVSRCQRFDLSRVKSEKLFKFIKKIKDLENGKINDDALKLIVKISEGSVRDALSLLDRALISQEQKEELNLKKAQKIFGYLDKSYLIELFKNIFEGKEKDLIESYSKIYDAGVEPKIFLNDFLEILYYFKNISSLKIEGTNFSLNDEEFNRISKIASTISPDTLLLFWQFTIKTLDELEIVSNQNISIEMFLIRLMYLKTNKKKIFSNDAEVKISTDQENYLNQTIKNDEEKKSNFKNKTISQIKNISQQESIKYNENSEQTEEKLNINTFNDLIKISEKKKEIKLKYELETNVNLVKFENQKIEISFNENLDKNFVKNLSSKLFEWTKNRWFISFSKEIGTPSKKQIDLKYKKDLLEEAKTSLTYNKIMDFFPDAELIDVKSEENND